MKIKFMIDPDDLTLEFITGKDEFWNAIKKEYGLYSSTIDDLDNILWSLLFNNPFDPDFVHSNKATYGDVINEHGQKLTVRKDTYNLLCRLEPKDQQTILADLATAFIGEYENLPENIKNYANC